MMRIALASDHAGFDYKEKIKLYLLEKKFEVCDFGTHSRDMVDYPQMIRPAALAVSQKECERGIILGGSGNGEAIVANRIPGIRCAVCWDVKSARLAREHNDANIISIGQRMSSLDLALKIIETWLQSEFAGGRHLRRIQQIDEEPS
ncbi:ribose 5-phosphate isomerase B [candidate division KSB1 bacterium]|nr:ribose 5-phosphate isomerase B [candidate division KSB1 bacterium]